MADERGRFDVWADWCADFVASVYFFAFCVLTVLVWLPSYFLFSSMDTWQLIINTFTTVATFLMLALLHNDQHRYQQSTNARLQAIMKKLGVEDPVKDEGQKPQ